VRAVPEGHAVFAGEPLLEVNGVRELQRGAALGTRLRPVMPHPVGAGERLRTPGGR
jgi:hypothetical protein